MDLKLKGRKALVQGASSGLGFAIAKQLAEEGAEVAICSRDEKRIQSAASAVGAKFAFARDLSRPGVSGRLIAEAAEKLGGLDILVVNTGGPPKGAFVDLSSESWLEGFQSLWISATESLRAAIPLMQAAHWGRLLLVTSAAAREPMPGLTISNGLRAGLLGLVKSVSNEVAQHGITINALLPGYTATERLKDLHIAEDKITAQIPARRLGQPEELAALTAFLASERASYITGQAIACDGGYLRGI